MSRRRTQFFACARCGTVNPDFLTFGVGPVPRRRYFCLHHIPRLVRVRMWLRERLGRTA